MVIKHAEVKVIITNTRTPNFHFAEIYTDDYYIGSAIGQIIVRPPDKFGAMVEIAGTLASVTIHADLVEDRRNN